MKKLKSFQLTNKSSLNIFVNKNSNNKKFKVSQFFSKIPSVYTAIYLRIKYYLDYQKRIKQKLKYIIEQYTGCNIKMYNLSLKKLKKITAKNSSSFLLGYPLGVKNRKITVLRKKHIYKLILKYNHAKTNLI